MHRRDLLRIAGAAALIPFLPREAEAAARFGALAHRAARAAGLQALSEDQAQVVTIIAEMIIPRTDTPGATDVDVTGFVDHLMAEWYDPVERQQFQAGIDALVAEGFAAASDDARAARLAQLDGVKGPDGSPEAAVQTLKSLTVYGYFTSERVVKEVTRDPIIPGRFEGCTRF
jgi:hypothetical protein